MNYFKFLDTEGNTVGVGGVGEGTENELSIMNYLMDSGYTIIKISKEEYDEYNEGDEIVLSKTWPPFFKGTPNVILEFPEKNPQSVKWNLRKV